MLGRSSVVDRAAGPVGAGKLVSRVKESAVADTGQNDCDCRWGRRGETSPGEAVAAGGFEMLSETRHPEAFHTEWLVVCTRCGRRYRVVDDMGYWKPLYQWTAL